MSMSLVFARFGAVPVEHTIHDVASVELLYEADGDVPHKLGRLELWFSEDLSTAAQQGLKELTGNAPSRQTVIVDMGSDEEGQGFMIKGEVYLLEIVAGDSL